MNCDCPIRSAEFASNPAAPAANSAAFDVNPAESPSNSANHASNAAELRMTCHESSAPNSAEFEANKTESESNAARSLSDRSAVTSRNHRTAQFCQPDENKSPAKKKDPPKIPPPKNSQRISKDRRDPRSCPISRSGKSAQGLFPVPSFHFQLPASYSLFPVSSGFKRGNKITSRIDFAPVSTIVSRSIPIPSPAVGGSP